MGEKTWPLADIFSSFWLVDLVMKMGQLGKVDYSSPGRRNEQTPKMAIHLPCGWRGNLGGNRRRKLNICKNRSGHWD